MAVARTGSISVVTDGSNTSSVSVTVPAGASLAMLFVCGYHGATGLFSAPGAAPTLGGSAMTLAVGSDDENLVGGCAYYLKNPPSGTQTYAWDWGGASNSSTGDTHFIVYYTGTDGTTPIGATVEDQATASPMSAGALANSSGDLVTAFGWAFRSGSAPGISWSNVTSVQAETQNAGAPGSYGAYAETAGTGTNITPSFTYTGDDVGIIGIVLKASGAAAAPFNGSVDGAVPTGKRSPSDLRTFARTSIQTQNAEILWAQSVM